MYIMHVFLFALEIFYFVNYGRKTYSGFIVDYMLNIQYSL